MKKYIFIIAALIFVIVFKLCNYESPTYKMQQDMMQIQLHELTCEEAMYWYGECDKFFTVDMRRDCRERYYPVFYRCYGVLKK